MVFSLMLYVHSSDQWNVGVATFRWFTDTNSEMSDLRKMTEHSAPVSWLLRHYCISSRHIGTDPWLRKPSPPVVASPAAGRPG
jgi:hypothetical protein